MTKGNNSKTDNEIELIIKTTQGEWNTTFSKTAKVEDVIDAAISHFGFSKSGSNFQLSLEGAEDELDPKRPLVSYGIEDKAILFLTDLGVAV